MIYCLNPKKSHENSGIFTSNDTLSGANDAQASVAVEERVACRFCKYLLQDAPLGDCRVTRWIGSGAFGDVYEAEQLPPLSRRVAIKVMSLERVGDEQSVELFEREVGAIAALDHPNILPVLRAGLLEDGRSYLVMKYAAHGSLQKFSSTLPQELSILPTVKPASEAISGGGAPENASVDTIIIEDEAGGGDVSDDDFDESRTVDLVAGESLHMLTPRQLLPFVESAAAALHYAHQHNLIHLDVKPANLLLDGNDHLLLADFGVSVMLDSYTHASLHCYVGTPVYTAPEQWLEQPRPASDQYALAITCYQLLTGHLPFTGNLYSIMHGHLRTPPPPPREWNPTIPEQVEAVILRALAKEPKERYRDMLAFATAYREAVELAANTQTDAQGQDRVKPAPYPTAVEPATKMRASEDEAASRLFSQTATIDDEIVPVRERGKLPTPPPRRSRMRVVIFVLLAFLLVSGGTLGALRVFNPCLMGICPGLKVSTNVVDITNNASQAVKITNSGTADLHWSVTQPVSVSWLAYSPPGGTLATGKTTTLTITTNTNNLPGGVDSIVLQIVGQGVTAQPINVQLTVQTGLSDIAATVSGNDFIFDQAGLHPASRTITINNHSSQPFNWYIEYKTSNSWLQIAPEQGTVPPGAKETLRVTANVQSLLASPPNSYLAEFTILGSLGQSDPGILSQLTFTLEMKQIAPTVTPQVTQTPTTPAFPSITFNAQSPQSTGAPTIDRSGHSMVWDDHDDLFFVFGGIDSAGNLLNDLWSYNPLTGQWTQIDATTPTAGSCAGGTQPAPRMNAAMVWDSADQQILLYGGVGANTHYLGDLWSYAPSTGAGSWKPLACSGNGPGARAANAIWNGSQMLLLGGMNKYGPVGDFWSYTPGGGNWQSLGVLPMGARAYQTLAWDATDNTLFAFGGVDASGAQSDDFYSYSANAGWTPIIPLSASNPKARQQGIGVWDSKDDMLLMTGGWNDSDQSGPYWGLWAYYPKENQWDLLTPLNSSNNHIMPGRTDSAMAWDATDQKAFIYAGAGNGKTGSSLNDLWIITSTA